ncbi:hypothetical protein [Sphaerisporangium aureirubrum]|uniref:Uncharacterized protein n=1 Tax=Sphaerisporangium aureirubrum TaxID=1544736 RepID=A0ABW1NG01_9ACTN
MLIVTVQSWQQSKSSYMHWSYDAKVGGIQGGDFSDMQPLRNRHN